MAIVLHFSPSSMTADKYYEAIDRLQDAGAASPDGRMYHVAYGSADAVQVLDIWESEEKFQAFGETLMPILGELGVDPGQPQPAEVHNVVEG